MTSFDIPSVQKSIHAALFFSGKKKAHKHKHFCPVGLRTNLGFSPYFITSVQTRSIVKGEAQKSPLFWRFSGGFWFSQDRLFSRNSTRKPLNLTKSPIFTNTPCRSTCLYNAPSMHTVDFTQWKPGKPGFVPGTNPVKSPGQTRGRRAAQKVYVKKAYVPFSLAIFWGRYTPARKDYIHIFLGLEFVSWKITFQLHKHIFSGNNFPKITLHVSIVIQTITCKNCLGIIFLENLTSVTHKNVFD